MVAQRLQNLDELKRLFSLLETYVQANDPLRHQDANIELENFFRDLLNRVFSWRLDNANSLFGKNQDSFDLTDQTSRIAVQVTVTTGATKIRETLDKFVGKHDADYDRLIFIYPILKLPRSTADFSDDLKGFPFDPNKDRIGLGEVIAEVQNFDITSQNEVLQLVKKELAPFCEIRTKSGPAFQSFSECLNASRARCIIRWRGVGLSREEAVLLFDDQNIGKADDALVERLKDQLVVITGDLGIGKSLVAERIHQKQIEAAQADNSAPIPVFLKASEAIGQFEQILRDKAQAYGEVNKRGLSFVIDGADEIEPSVAYRILENARIAVEQWKLWSGIITSRKIAVFDELPEEFQLRELTEEEALKLASSIAKHEIRNWGLPKSVVDSCRRPLFAILLGVYRRRNSETPKTTAQLLQHLVTSALKKEPVGDAKTLTQVQRLAVDCTNQGTLAIRDTDITENLEPLVSAGILTKFGHNLGFALPVYCEWFAAQALVEEVESVEKLTSSSNALERWRYALIIFTGVNSHNTVLRVLGPIAEYSPGFVASIINDAIEQWRKDELGHLGTPIESGRRIREVMERFVNGLGPLARSIAPVDETGTLHQMGVHQEDSWLTVAWSRTTGEPNIIEMESGWSFGEPLDKKWAEVRQGHPASESTWAWRWVCDHLKGKLSAAVKNRIIMLPGGLVWKEQAWKDVCRIADQGGYNPTPISKNIVIDYLDKYDASVGAIRRGIMGQGFTTGPITLHNNINTASVRAFVQGIAGDTITPVHPPPDIDWRSQWPWNGYSKAQLLARVKSVIKSALDEYGALTQLAIGTLHRQLNVANFLPAKYVGMIEFPENENAFGNQPWIWHYLTPLPFGSENEVDIKFKSNSTDNFDTDWHEVSKALRLLRKDNCDSAHAWFGQSVLDCFGPDPGTKLVYEWLEKDLRQVSLI